MNTAALRTGTAKAKKLIEDHIVNQILIPMLHDLVDTAIEGRQYGSNMTGNTANSYGGALFVRGSLRHIYLPDIVKPPLMGKIKEGKVFEKGWQRWDDNEQKHSFGGSGTDDSVEPNAIRKFLMSYKSQTNGYEAVVSNGVEYASYQENQMDIDVLTGNFNYAKMIHSSFFKPIPD